MILPVSLGPPGSFLLFVSLPDVCTNRRDLQHTDEAMLPSIYLRIVSRRNSGLDP